MTPVLPAVAGVDALSAVHCCEPCFLILTDGVLREEHCKGLLSGACAACGVPLDSRSKLHGIWAQDVEIIRAKRMLRGAP